MPKDTALAAPEAQTPATRGVYTDAERELLRQLQLPEEDETPLESHYHALQQQLLAEVIHQHFTGRTDYFCGTNMFVFYSLEQAQGITDFVEGKRESAPYKGPDLLVVVGVDGTKRRKHWVVWDEDDRFPDLIVEITSPSTKCLCIIFSIPPRPTASSLQPPPHAAKPHPHNNDAASNHPSHDATPFPSSSNEDYNTVNNAHATHTPTNAPNTYESPANDETTHYPNTPPSAHPDALPPALTHPNTAPQPPSDTNPTPPQTLSDAPRPLASPNDLSHSHDPHAHPRAAHRAPCPPPSNYTPKATIT
jgi:hypothetical protein